MLIVPDFCPSMPAGVQTGLHVCHGEAAVQRTLPKLGWLKSSRPFRAMLLQNILSDNILNSVGLCLTMAAHSSMVRYNNKTLKFVRNWASNKFSSSYPNCTWHVFTIISTVIFLDRNSGKITNVSLHQPWHWSFGCNQSTRTLCHWSN